MASGLQLQLTATPELFCHQAINVRFAQQQQVT
jgi:hypothetical protein